MKTNHTDSELVKAVLEKYQFTHDTLAKLLCVSRVAVTQWVSGSFKLRTAIRERLEEMLEENKSEE